MTAPNPVPTIGRQVNYCVPPTPTGWQSGPDGIGIVAKEVNVTSEGVVTQPASVGPHGGPVFPTGQDVGGGADPWIVQTATISAVADDVATSGLVTLSVFTNDPTDPLAVITDVPYGDGKFVPGAWNWPTITTPTAGRIGVH